jgi:cytochrome c oxidase accessory protein FixG
MCVDTCPTGIDIRDGLQMECIACTQCIDACDSVMDKISKPRGLIRFSSQARIGGTASRLLRPRVIIYPAAILVLIAAFGVVLGGKQSADVTLLRGLGLPFTELKAGETTNQIRVKIQNRGEADAEYRIELVDDAKAILNTPVNPIPVAADASRTEPIFITVPAAAFQGGQYEIRLRVSDGKTFDRELTYRLLGPQS